jgi:hypothetical protein
MSRRYRSESVEVVMDEHGEPVVFRWRGRRYAVQVIVTSWVEAVPWWTGEFRAVETRTGEFLVDRASGQRHVWRVEAAPRTGITGVYDLYRIVRGQRWCWGLARVID